MIILGIILNKSLSDKVFNLDDAKASAKILADYGQNIDVFVLKGHNHWYYDIAPFVNEKAWAYLTSYT